MAYKFFNKKSAGTFTQTETRINSKNQQLAEELHKPIITKFYKSKEDSSSKDSIWRADVAYM